MLSADRKAEDEVDLEDDWDIELIGVRFLDAPDGEVECEVAEGSVGGGAAGAEGARV